MMSRTTKWRVGPALAAPSRSLGGGWPPSRSSLGKRPAGKPLDGFDKLTAGMLGALSLSKRRRPYIPLHEFG
jgi:hypothetical protein